MFQYIGQQELLIGTDDGFAHLDLDVESPKIGGDSISIQKIAKS